VNILVTIVVTGLIVVFEAFWVTILSTFMMGEMPEEVLCHCPALPGTHMISRLMLLHGVAGTGLGLIGIVGYGRATALVWVWPLLHGVWTLWRWWRHTKNERKKRLQRILGRVRDLGWRLVVEPAGGEA